MLQFLVKQTKKTQSYALLIYAIQTYGPDLKAHSA